MIFVDTAFDVAWVNSKHVLHARALDLLEKHQSSPWITTDCILLEIGNSLARNFRVQAVGTIENFLTDEAITIIGLDPGLFNRAFRLFRKRNDKSWGLIDCVSFIVMREHNVTGALTSDQHFQQAGFNALMIES